MKCSLSDLYIVDSMPLKVCRLSRANRSKVCQEHIESAPNFGFCVAQDMKYFGYKLHAACTPEGVIKMFDISKASLHDIQYLNDIQGAVDHCVLVGGKGYLSQQWQSDLFQTSSINLQTPMRKNQLNFKGLLPSYRKVRKRIETLFSQLCDQFMIRRNYAKSFKGISRRVVTKIAALTLIQWVNFSAGNKLNNLKIVIS
ncbi:IS982 family transposase [Marinomonas transparens]|uniref:IS982 family transposase n=1 Tax=Marinomonas transparens TaxID=2795388 RepID=UPI003F6A0200